MSRIKVLYVEDDPDWREGIRVFLSSYAEIELIACVPTLNECFEQLQANAVDIVIMDIVLDEYGTSGLDGALDLSVHYPNVKIIMLSSLDEHDDIFNEAFLNGAYDYVYKSEFEQLPNVMSAAISNQQTKYGERLKKLVYEKKKSLLSEGDIIVLKLLLLNMTQTQIAEQLNVSIAAVKKQVGRVKRKFNWNRSSKELADKCQKWGVLD